MERNKLIKLIWGICITAFIVCAVFIGILTATGAIHINFSDKQDTYKQGYKSGYDAGYQKGFEDGIISKSESPDNKPDGRQITKSDAKQTEDEKSEKTPAVTQRKGIIVLDPGHGISSSAMSSEQKNADGWLYNSAKGGWGEWRHFKSGTMWQDCNGSGCTGRAPKNGGCWYGIGSGDRDTEPEINMNNVLAAKKYLEQMGYEVRITRTSDNNPSMTKRLEYCYPNNDTAQTPDADVFVCVHSNAGGGRGSCYIALSGKYDQAGIPADYVDRGNTLGKMINDKIVAETELQASGGGRYDGYPELVLFCKSPVTIAYMEIGFYDNAGDLSILRSSSDAIGKAIADGINEYMTKD